MKNLKFNFLTLIITCISICFLSCSQSSQPSDQDIEGVKAYINHFNEELNKHDKEATDVLYMEDADFTYPTGVWIKGRQSIPTLQKGLTRDFEIEDIRFLDANTAIVNFNNHFTGGTDENGNKVADIWNASTVVLHKQNGEWMDAATRLLPARIDNAEAEAGIKESWSKFSEYWEKGDAENAAALFTEDAINMVPDVNSNVGKEEIKKLLQQFATANTIKNIRTTTKELDVMGRTAYEYGIYEDTIAPKNGKSFNRKIRYYSVWKLEADNVWRIHRFIFNDVPGGSGS